MIHHQDLFKKSLPLNNWVAVRSLKAGSGPFYGLINKDIESTMGGSSLILSLISGKLKRLNTKVGTKMKASRYFPPLCPCFSLSRPSLNTKLNSIPPALPLFSKVVVCVKERVMSCQSIYQGLIHGWLPGRTELLLQWNLSCDDSWCLQKKKQTGTFASL